MRSRPLNIGFQYSGSSSGFSGRHITIATPTKSPVSNAVGPGALGTRATEPRSHLMRTATCANLRWPDMLRAGFARASSASWPGARGRPLTQRSAQRPVSSSRKVLGSVTSSPARVTALPHVCRGGRLGETTIGWMASDGAAVVAGVRVPAV